VEGLVGLVEGLDADELPAEGRVAAEFPADGRVDALFPVDARVDALLALFILLPAEALLP
jgi:hypothetical protein